MSGSEEAKKLTSQFDKKCKLKRVDNIIGTRGKLYEIPAEWQEKLINNAREQIIQVVEKVECDLRGKDPDACKYIGYFCQSVVREYFIDNALSCPSSLKKQSYDYLEKEERKDTIIRMHKDCKKEINKAIERIGYLAGFTRDHMDEIRSRVYAKLVINVSNGNYNLQKKCTVMKFVCKSVANDMTKEDTVVIPEYLRKYFKKDSYNDPNYLGEETNGYYIPENSDKPPRERKTIGSYDFVGDAGVVCGSGNNDDGYCKPVRASGERGKLEVYLVMQIFIENEWDGSEREKQVMLMRLDGISQTEMARILETSPPTITREVKKIQAREQEFIEAFTSYDPDIENIILELE